MKNTIIFIFSFCLLGAISMFGQSAKDYRSQYNAIFIGQDEVGQKGIANDDFGDIYLNWMFNKNGSNILFGPYLIAGVSANNNISGYNGDSKSIGAGFNLDYYSNGLLTHYEIWGEINAGLKYQQDNGSITSYYGTYRGRQDNTLLSLGLDWNLWNKNIFAAFPRTQFQSSLILPLSQDKKGYWNGTPTTGERAWDMTYGEVILKESILNVFLGNGTFLAPKLVGSYSHNDGDQENLWGYGGEVSLHKPYRDDYISIYCLYKISDKYENKLAMGIIANFTAFFL